MYVWSAVDYLLEHEHQEAQCGTLQAGRGGAGVQRADERDQAGVQQLDQAGRRERRVRRDEDGDERQLHRGFRARDEVDEVRERGEVRAGQGGLGADDRF